MGDWHLTVTASGPHDNGEPYDAEALADHFLTQLSTSGHMINTAQLTIGARRDVLVEWLAEENPSATPAESTDNDLHDQEVSPS